MVDEVRIGDRRWERAEHILAVINAKRAETTRRLIDAVGPGIEEYIATRGKPPAAASSRDLASALTPDFMPQAIILDAWANPFSYRVSDAGDWEIRSMGADGRTGTPDDIVGRASDKRLEKRQ